MVCKVTTYLFTIAVFDLLGRGRGAKWRTGHKVYGKRSSSVDKRKLCKGQKDLIFFPP